MKRRDFIGMSGQAPWACRIPANRKPRPRGRGFRIEGVARGRRRGAWSKARAARESEPVEDLIGPKPLKAVQRLVQGREFVGVDAAELFDRAHMLVIERIDDCADVAA